MNLFGQSNQKLFPEVEKQSLNATQEKIEKLKKLFPNVINDGKIDWKTLKLMLGENITEEDERYRFTWNGKNKAIQEVGISTTSTLRPDKNSSKDWETTENIYIEGDNLETLKVLQNSYNGKIKMIYIDPPYNTGNDFIYKDDFTLSLEEVEKQEGLKDKKGIIKTVDRLTKNSKDSAKYHTNWLNMMYPRLTIARDLLTDDGVIFISIDDNEVHNLRKICDEIFGESGFVAEFIWEKKKKPSFLNVNLGFKTEYILAYSKNRNLLGSLSVDVTEKGKKYPINNAGNSLGKLVFPPKSVKFGIEDCIIEPQDMSEGNIVTKLLTELVIKNGYNENEFTLLGEWRYSQSKLNDIIAQGDTITISKIPFRPNHIKEGGEIKKIHNLLTSSTYNVGTNEDATSEQINLFGKSFFDYTKPVGLLNFFIKATTFLDNDSIILDFFSGSATTAHAVMKLNAEDGGNRKFIMVQLPENCEEKSEAYKEGYKNICEIGKERIKRAGKKILEENKNKDLSQLDIGFKTFKIDSSNFNEWDTSYEAMKKAVEESSEGKFTTYKEDRTDLDLVYEIMLKEGLLLTESIEETKMNAGTLYKIAEGVMYIFLKKLDKEVVKKIIDLKMEAQELYGLDNPTVILNEAYLDTELKCNAKKNFEVNGIVNIKTL